MASASTEPLLSQDTENPATEGGGNNNDDPEERIIMEEEPMVRSRSRCTSQALLMALLLLIAMAGIITSTILGRSWMEEKKYARNLHNRMHTYSKNVTIHVRNVTIADGALQESCQGSIGQPFVCQTNLLYARCYCTENSTITMPIDSLYTELEYD